MLVSHNKGKFPTGKLMGNNEWNTYSMTILIPSFQSFVFNLFSEINLIIFFLKSVKSYDNVFKKSNSETVMRGNFIIIGGKSVLYSLVGWCTLLHFRAVHYYNCVTSTPPAMGSYRCDVPSVECSYKLRRFHGSNRNCTVAHIVGIWVETFFVAMWRTKLCRSGVKILPLNSTHKQTLKWC